MLQFVLATLAVVGADPSLAQQNAREIAQARAEVADMARIAVTAEEKALAKHDSEVVERAARLLSERDNQRPRAVGKPAIGVTPGNGVGVGASSGGGQGADPIGSAAGTGSQDDLLAATKQMEETQMSFNLQYLQLQSQMQDDKRRYTAVSSLMKTKHDTVKNSISNIR